MEGSSITEPEGSGDQTAALRELASQLAFAEVRERRRIAEELHDHLGQYLALIRMKLSSFTGNIIFSGYEQDLLDIQDLLEKAIQYTRHLTMAVSPPVLYELGLVPALRWLSEQYAKRHSLDIQFQADPSIPEIEDDMRGMIYRSIRELLFNVVKHAQAHRVCVTVRFDDGFVAIVVSDDGQGFDERALHPGGGSGFGLFSIRERLQHLGGRLELTSRPGRGTEATVVFPVSRRCSP